MGYRNLRACIDDLERAGHLIRVEAEIDARLEAAEIHRRVYRSGGPALFFAKVKGGHFPMVSNLFGTMERVRFLFFATLVRVGRATELNLRTHPDPIVESAIRGGTGQAAGLLGHVASPLSARADPGEPDGDRPVTPRTVLARWTAEGSSCCRSCTRGTSSSRVDEFQPGHVPRSALGGRYEPNREIGLHYQLHRGIGVHHANAVQRGAPLRVDVFVAAPAMLVAAVMPLPEGVSELTFAGILAGHRIPMVDCRRRRAELRRCSKGGCRSTRRPTSHRRNPRSREDCCPKGPSGIILGTTASPTTFPFFASSHLYHRQRGDLAFYRGGPAAQEDTVFGERFTN